MILTDDQGPWALGCAGTDELSTPNLDQLAASGTRFENFYASSPVCSPARASLLTGTLPSQHGIHDALSGGNVGEDAVTFLAGRDTFVTALAQAGYRTAHIGKWHLGASDRRHEGYQHWVALAGGAADYYGAQVYRDPSGWELTNGYLTDWLTDEALRFLSAPAEPAQPFCVNLNFTAPHAPLVGQHPADLVDRYAEATFGDIPDLPPHPWCRDPEDDFVSYRAARLDRRANLQHYYAAVSGIDRNVGRLIDWLEQRGLRESTLVIFLSDNGFCVGHHGVWGKGNATDPQNVFEESVKVPAIMSQPRRVTAGAVNRDLVSAYDLMPTIAEWTGTALPDDGRPRPGRSLASLLLGTTSAVRDDVVIFDEYGPTRMVRTPRWKYVHRYPYGRHELYDLVDDPTEAHNRVDDPGLGEVRRDLLARLERFFRLYADPDVDGVREPVRGYGQYGLAGVLANGADRHRSTIPTQRFRGS